MECFLDLKLQDSEVYLNVVGEDKGLMALMKRLVSES